jgi:two-component system response regulator
VEDNEDDVEVTLLAFRRAGISNVIVARDGVEALDYLLSAEGSLPRVVFLDLNMPRLDGFQVLQSLRANPRTECLPVVVLTSSTRADDLAAAYRAGANSYVRKSIDADVFDGIAEQLGRYWLTLNEVAS